MTAWTECFDRIVCINLIERRDKKKYVQGVFDTMQIRVEFFEAQKHPKGGRYGCFHSHICVIADAYAAGVRKLLVFEDDIMLAPSFTNGAILQETVDFMQCPRQDWEYFQLGHFPIVDESLGLEPYFNAKRVSGYNHIIKFMGLSTHAYCINRKGMKKILESNWREVIDNMHVDVFFVQNVGLKGYCVIPTLFVQKLCLRTDNNPRTPLEVTARKFSCVAEKLDILYNVSLIKYAFTAYDIVVIVLLCFFVVFVIVLLHIGKKRS